MINFKSCSNETVNDKSRLIQWRNVNTLQMLLLTDLSTSLLFLWLDKVVNIYVVCVEIVLYSIDCYQIMSFKVCFYLNKYKYTSNVPHILKNKNRVWFEILRCVLLLRNVYSRI